MRKLEIGACVACLTTLFVATEVAGQSAPSPASVRAAPLSAGPVRAAATPTQPAGALLPAGPGHDTTVRVCSGCHAPEIAAQQRLSEQGWKEVIDTMAGRGAQGSEADFAEITAYLSKNFPDKPAS